MEAEIGDGQIMGLYGCGKAGKCECECDHCKKDKTHCGVHAWECHHECIEAD